MTPITCTTCREPIPRGEQYIAIDRHTERQGRLGAVTVKEAELLAAYHMACVPDTVSVPVLMRFVTLGGAAVELRSHRFMTKVDPGKGRPYVLDHTYEANGYAWRCQGCGHDGRRPYEHKQCEYLRKDLHEARADANAHAHECRAMPRAEVPR